MPPGIGGEPRRAATSRDQPPQRRPVSGSTLTDLAAEAATCVRCRLSESRTQVVFGVGDRAADLLFVGEGPGAQEDLLGEPFVGRSGKVAPTRSFVAEEIGMTRAQFYIANVVKCRPPNNRDPLPDEVEACRPFLEGQIAAPRAAGRRHARGTSPRSACSGRKTA